MTIFIVCQQKTFEHLRSVIITCFSYLYQLFETFPKKSHKMKDSSPKKYVSCIKIKGVPILPPLITPERRKELGRYKREAIKVENRLKRERELKKRITELYSNCSDTQNSSLIVESFLTTNSEDNTIIHQEHITDLELKNYVNQLFQTNENIVQENDFDQGTESKNDDKNKWEPPKLIRSNSYVLDTPSPALVEYYKNKVHESSPFGCLNKENPQTKNSNTSNIQIEQNVQIKQNDHQIESDICDNINQLTLLNNSIENLNIEIPLSNDIHEISSNPDFDTSRTETELKYLSDCDSQIPENIHEIISNNVPRIDENLQIEENPVKTLDLTLNDVLNKLPEEYSKQILEILERQQVNSTNTSTNLYEKFDKDIEYDQEKYSTPAETTLVTNSESVYFSAEDVTIRNSEESEKKRLTRDKAAEILCAFTKGFLVRRLMKTERVQILIQTIKEALLCAVQLHTETLENISESDVELHRRLIQQVSAACYAFHDVFFNTSVHDQLSYIAVDRQKKRDKLRRLSSANSTTTSSSSLSARRNTPRTTKTNKNNSSNSRNRRASTRF